MPKDVGVFTEIIQITEITQVHTGHRFYDF